MVKIWQVILVVMLVGGWQQSANAGGYFNCVPKEIMEKSSYIHVLCENSFSDGSDTVRYLTFPLSDQAKANRFLSLTLTSMVSDRDFRVFWMDKNNNLGGCALHDCRTVSQFAILK